MKKRVIKIILLIAGILLIAIFFATIVYDYYLIKTRIFAVPLGLEFTAIMSGLLFLLPGIICLIVSFLLRRKAD